MCDADLSLMGFPFWFERIDRYRQELGINDIKKWYEIQEKFLSSHDWFTKSAKELFQKQKLANLERVKKEFPDLTIIPTSAEAELALKEAAKKELVEYIPGESVHIKGNLTKEQEPGMKIIQDKIIKRYTTTGVQRLNSNLASKLIGAGHHFFHFFLS